MKRNISLDIARGLSIVLIVLSHTPFGYSYLFDFFYVQVFFFLSGVFIKSSHTVENSLYKKVKALIYPYLFFAVISSIAVLVLGRNTIDGIHLYGHYKIFCVNVKYGIQYEFRIFLFNRFAK